MQCFTNKPSRQRNQACFVFLVALGLGCAEAAPFKALVFSATAGFRHESITNGLALIRTLGSNNNFSVDSTENPTQFNATNLAQYKVLIFLSTTGDVLTNAQQQTALQD